MAKYRNELPQLGADIFLTDSGLETYLYFKRGIDLPEFAAFTLLENDDGRALVGDYMESHIGIALDHGLGFIMETPTWRASRDWGKKLGYGRKALDRVNRHAVAMMAALRARFETEDCPMVISGNIGPRGDGYRADALMSPEAAEDYHADQVETFAEAGADLVTSLTITHVGEAAGIVRAARKRDIPVVISFTTETDGHLPEGRSLGEAIMAVDELTDGGPVYYMVNCAHPTHFDKALEDGAGWVGRIRGIRANASRKSHEELDNSTHLDEGDPAELGSQYRALCTRLPHITILGGCCGTDDRHVARICEACT